MPIITHLFIYPIKSLGGITVSEAEVTDRGFQYDRRWMLVDAQNNFMSQRSLAEMALLQVHLLSGGLVIQHKKTGDKLEVPFTPTGEILKVKVWSFEGKAIEVSREVSEWFTQILNQPCKLVYMPDATKRRVDTRYAFNLELTSFTDAFPFLAIGQSSLDDLNNRLQQPLPMDRFRPNIVFTGAAPFDEDEWAEFNINDINFYGAKLCARCAVTTIDQQEATRGKEPLSTLATYRSFANKIYFGQYLLHSGNGSIHTGDSINVTERKKARFPRTF